jgi:hypothetical protein
VGFMNSLLTPYIESNHKRNDTSVNVQIVHLTKGISERQEWVAAQTLLFDSLFYFYGYIFGACWYG